MGPAEPEIVSTSEQRILESLEAILVRKKEVYNFLSRAQEMKGLCLSNNQICSKT